MRISYVPRRNHWANDTETEQTHVLPTPKGNLWLVSDEGAFIFDQGRRAMIPYFFSPGPNAIIDELNSIKLGSTWGMFVGRGKMILEI